MNGPPGAPRQSCNVVHSGTAQTHPLTKPAMDGFRVTSGTSTPGRQSSFSGKPAASLERLAATRTFFGIENDPQVVSIVPLDNLIA